MPINAFGGGPGSGKTYGVMEHVILPAIGKGRFIITNIEGLDEEAIYEYAAREFYKGKIICIGHIRHCDRDAPGLENFFPGADSLDKPGAIPSPDFARVAGGDLVVIDEATRYWSGSDKVKKEHAYFFREHRHFVNELGHSCDMVVIDPDLSMLARALKGKIELSSVTHKPKEVGLNRYVVNLYRGARLTSKPTSTQGPYKFQEKIYSLYKSYAHEGAKEQSIDRRQNLFNNPRLWFYFGSILLLFTLCIWGLYAYYQGQVKKFAPDPIVTAKPGGTASAVPSAAPVRTSAATSANLRVAGELVLNGKHWILLSDSVGLVRLENPAAFVGAGLTIVGNIEGQRVATWTGAANKSQSIVGGRND